MSPQIATVYSFSFRLNNFDNVGRHEKELVSCPPVAFPAVSPNPHGGRCPAVSAHAGFLVIRASRGGGLSLESPGSRTTARSVSSSEAATGPAHHGTAAARGRHRPYIKRTVAFGLISSSRELTAGGQYAELNSKWAIVTTNASSTSSHPHLPTASAANNSEGIF